MRIWKNSVSLDELNAVGRNTIHDALGIQFVEIGDDYLEATLPVDHRTKQPAGLLHGGASVVLAESLGSIASLLVAGFPDATGVGIEINASHLRAVSSGSVIGRVTPIRLGRQLHVWQIRIREEAKLDSRQICECRLTVMIPDRNPKP